MRLATVIAALLFSAQALGQSLPIRGASYCDDKHLPPAEFDHEPTVPYLVQKVPSFGVNYMCNMQWAPLGAVGACVDFQDEGDEPIIWVRDDLTPTEYACVIRHERAHVNGWRHTYSDTPSVPRGRVGAIIRYMPKP